MERKTAQINDVESLDKNFFDEWGRGLDVSQ